MLHRQARSEPQKCAAPPSRDVSDIHTDIFLLGCNRNLAPILKNISAMGCNPLVKQTYLHFYIDHCANSAPVFDQAVDFDWPCGRKFVTYSPSLIGLRRSWMKVFEKIKTNHKLYGNYASLILEDDMRVSPALWAFFGNFLSVPDHVVGVSMSPIKVQEMSKPFRRWKAFETVASHLYETSLPSSWGPVYYSWFVSSFISFVDARLTVNNAKEEERSKHVKDYGMLRLQPHDLEIRGLRSNVWPFSWKKYLIEWMHINAFTMIYPNLPGETGFATSTFEKGEHANGQPNDRFAFLVQDYADVKDLIEKVSKRPVIDMQLNPSSLRALAEASMAYTRQVYTSHRWIIDRATYRQCLLDRVNIPRFCSPTNQTIIFEPQYGVNNQAIALVHAVRLGHLTGRGIYSPSVYHPHACSTCFRQPAESYFEFSVPVVNTYDKRAVKLCTEPKNSNLFSTNFTSGLPAIDIGPLTSQNVLQWFDKCNDTTLAFDGLFSGFTDMPRTRLPIKPELYTSASVVSEALRLQNSFVCVHHRNGDFERACRDWINRGGWFAEMYSKGFSCYLTTEQMLQQVPTDKTLLILSPDVNAVEQASPYAITSEDVRKSALGFGISDPVKLIIIEQILCSNANAVILNRFSTFSSSIEQMVSDKKKIKYLKNV